MDEYPIGKLRELVAGDLEHANEHLHQHTGLVGDEQLSAAMSFCEGNLELADVEADSFAETELGRQLTAAAATSRATDAVDAASAGARASYYSGITELEVSLSEAQVLMKLLGIVRPTGRILVWTGGTNHGKTNTALLMIELAVEDDPDMLVATNMQSLGGVDYTLVESQSELLEFLETNRGAEKIVWLDEASSHMTGYAGDRHDVEQQMRPVVRAAAKEHARLLYGAHRVTDVHPTIRDMPNCRFVANERLEDVHGQAEEYVAEVYEDVGPDGDLAGDPVVLRELPQTSLEYDPDEKTSWSWD